jgi:hypothetical protein
MCRNCLQLTGNWCVLCQIKGPSPWNAVPEKHEAEQYFRDRYCRTCVKFYANCVFCSRVMPCESKRRIICDTCEIFTNTWKCFGNCFGQLVPNTINYTFPVATTGNHYCHPCDLKFNQREHYGTFMSGETFITILNLLNILFVRSLSVKPTRIFNFLSKIAPGIKWTPRRALQTYNNYFSIQVRNPIIDILAAIIRVRLLPKELRIMIMHLVLAKP